MIILVSRKDIVKHVWWWGKHDIANQTLALGLWMTFGQWALGWADVVLLDEKGQALLVGEADGIGVAQRRKYGLMRLEGVRRGAYA